MISITEDIKRFLANFTKLENRFISFERCFFFMNIPAEEGYKHLGEIKRSYQNMIVNDFKQKKLNIDRSVTEWPRTGKLEFEHFSVKYRSDLDYVLKNITFKLETGTKLGILGRTGAGKTTLISSVFRYFAQFEGDIFIDDVRIRDLDIQRLRSSMTIIPQDPILFHTTLKKNLDPDDAHSDQEVESVLKDVKLWDKFKDQGVNYMIEPGGSNLSQGEKQLLCFGRALLKNNKLILMDEATANIDAFTEKTIQQLMQEKFTRSTIMMIAHKLNTVMICNK